MKLFLLRWTGVIPKDIKTVDDLKEDIPKCKPPQPNGVEYDALKKRISGMLATVTLFLDRVNLTP